jgi:DNA helicase IV
VQIVACREGRDVGKSQEVRVFDIQHIKGLEFEAVFFIGVDALAELMPDLFDRYIYVGVTRAATFLGVTCNAQLPEKLERIRPLLSSGGWD